MSETFLSHEEIAELTSRKVRAKPIEALRQMGIVHWVNPMGRAIIAHSIIEGHSAPAEAAARASQLEASLYQKVAVQVRHSHHSLPRAFSK